MHVSASEHQHQHKPASYFRVARDGRGPGKACVVTAPGRRRQHFMALIHTEGCTDHSAIALAQHAFSLSRMFR